MSYDLIPQNRLDLLHDRIKMILKYNRSIDVESIASILDVPLDDVASFLKMLAQQDLVKSVLRSTLICPKCTSEMIEYHNICPNCKKSNVVRGKIIEHYKCKKAYPKPYDMDKCPECNKKIGNLGTDYFEHENHYACKDCYDKFPEAKCGFKCKNCNHNFNDLDSQRKEIAYYEIINKESWTDMLKMDLEEIKIRFPIDTSDPLMDIENGTQRFQDMLKELKEKKIPFNIVTKSGSLEFTVELLPSLELLTPFATKALMVTTGSVVGALMAKLLSKGVKNTELTTKAAKHCAIFTHVVERNLEYESPQYSKIQDKKLLIGILDKKGKIYEYSVDMTNGHVEFGNQLEDKTKRKSELE